MQKTGIEEGVVAIKCIDPTMLDWLNTIPPLGTVDEDGNPTSEISADSTIAGTYKKSQAVKGMFEQVYGKVGLSFTPDQNMADSLDITIGMDKTKGYQNVEGTFEFQMLNDNARWEGAVLGNWDYLARGYYRRREFRPYEINVLLEPNSKTLGATTAERIYKFIGVKLGRVEVETGQPNVFRVPFFAKRLIILPNWSQPSATKLLDDEAVADGSISLTTPIQTPNVFHTRLKFTFTSVTTAADLTITGYNIYGEKITETVDLSAETGAFEYITKQHFSSVCTDGVVLSGSWSAGTFDIDEYDIGLLGC